MSQAKLLLAFSANVQVPVAGEANQKVLERSTLISSVCSSSDEDSVVDCTPIRKREPSLTRSAEHQLVAVFIAD